jgi:hypothetical protein
VRGCASNYGSDLYRCERPVYRKFNTQGNCEAIFTTSADSQSTEIQYQIASRFVARSSGYGRDSSGDYSRSSDIAGNYSVSNYTFQTNTLACWNGLTGSNSSEWFPVTGAIPDAWGSGMAGLKELHLPALQLADTLPDSLGGLQVSSVTWASDLEATCHAHNTSD